MQVAGGATACGRQSESIFRKSQRARSDRAELGKVLERIGGGDMLMVGARAQQCLSNVRAQGGCEVRFGSMLLKKGSLRGELATLIQGRAQVRKLDSKIRLFGFVRFKF
jgi:hypothetical protein